jgi:peptidoglycan/LPS O-acetylase OafA/YrhL
MTLEPRHVWLDLVRGLSALAVAAGHLRLVMMCDYGDLREPQPWQTAFYLLTGLSSQAVMVFFVLSGFLVGGSVLRAGPRFHFGEYAIARLVRLWVVLLPALVFTLLVDEVTDSLDARMTSGGLFARWTSGPMPGAYSTSTVTFLGNLAFVNTVFVESYGSNGPLWSLACEFWYYLLFPILMRAAGLVGDRPHWLTRIVLAALAAGVLVLMPKTMAWGFVVWLMGVGVAVVSRRWPPSTSARGLLFGLALFALAMVYSKIDRYGYTTPVPPRFVVGFGFAILALMLVRLTTFPKPMKWLALKLADISYSFYLTHFPVVILIGVALYADRERQASARDLVEYVGWFIVSIAVSVPFWWIFERKTHHVRSAVRAAFDRRALSGGLSVKS